MKIKNQNSNKNIETMFRLMNHDSSHTEPRFDRYTLSEHNKQFGTNYTSVEADPEYLFTEEQMEEYLQDDLE